MIPLKAGDILCPRSKLLIRCSLENSESDVLALEVVAVDERSGLVRCRWFEADGLEYMWWFKPAQLLRVVTREEMFSPPE